MKFNMKHVACILHTVPIIIFCSVCIWSPYFIKISLLVTKVMCSWKYLIWTKAERHLHIATAGTAWLMETMKLLVYSFCVDVITELLSIY